jgi:hypothetical protein
MGIEEDVATGAACAALVGAMASKPDFGGMAYRLSVQQGVLMGRRLRLCRKPPRATRPVYSRCTRVESNVYRSLVRNDPFLDVIPIREGGKMLRTLISAMILAGALAGSAMAQAPDAGCALPSEPKGIPAAVDAAITGPADKDRACMKALFIPEARMIFVSLGTDGAPSYRIETLHAGPAMSGEFL